MSAVNDIFHLLKGIPDHREWSVAKSGRSVNVGNFGKIRIEPGLPEEQVLAIAQLIAVAPEKLFELAKNLDNAHAEINRLRAELQQATQNCR